MSSRPRNRTSTGKVTACPCRCAAARSPVIASWTAARGTAYSISRNRTRRELQNTSYERATYSPAAICAATSRLIRGTSRGAAAPIRQASANPPLPSSSSPIQAAARLRSGSVASVRLLHLIAATSVCGNQ